jgi:hypothetical protein
MFPQFDPNKMDPKLLMELSQIVQSLPPDQLNRMQGLMHNAMAGFDVRAEMAEFERNLPAGFREKITRLVASNPAAFGAMGMPGGFGAADGESPQQTPIRPMSQTISASVPPAEEVSTASSGGGDMGMHEARMTVLRGVAAGQVSPEEAEKLLFGA